MAGRISKSLKALAGDEQNAGGAVLMLSPLSAGELIRLELAKTIIEKHGVNGSDAGAVERWVDALHAVVTKGTPLA